MPRLPAAVALAVLFPCPVAAGGDDSWSDAFGWPPGGLGLGAYSWAAAEYDGGLIVGGSFFEAGPLAPCGHIARFDGTTWTGRLRGGVDGVVTALAAWNGQLVAGGVFGAAGPWQPGGAVAATNIAAWDGLWSPLGAGLNDNPTAFGEWNGTLVAGGYFTEAGGAPAHRVATWDGAAWSPLGNGLGGAGLSSERVQGLAVAHGFLYAGGNFTEIDGVPVTGLARWDGSTWSDFGTTITPGDSFFGGLVSALLPVAGGLLVGGNIDAVNGTPVNGVALFDGTSWSAFDAGLDPGAAVRDLTTYRGRPVAAGGLSLGGSASSGIAQWDGAAWQPLGSGVQSWDLFSDWMWATEFGEGLYVGGNVARTGGKVAAFLGRWLDPATGVTAPPRAAGPLLSIVPNPSRGSTDIEVAVSRPGLVDVAVHDLAGRRVLRLDARPRPAGAHRVEWPGVDARGVPVASGVYFVRVRTPDGDATARVVLRR